MSFQNKIIVITGASSGIGKALALGFLAQGAKVALCARNLEKLQEAFGVIDNNNLLLVAADVSKENDCKDFVQAVLEKWGSIDALINNAGISMRALFEEVELDVLRNLMDINFWGTVYMSKYALPSILKSKGIIAGVSSIAGYRLSLIHI